MKLKRAWPAICIWVVFVLFDIVMVASSSFFSGLFPSDNLMVYVGIFTGLSILAMSILTFALGKVSDSLMAHDFKDNVPFKILYAILAVLILVGGFWYRLEILSNCSGDVTGKYSLYENAMIGGDKVVSEYDLLSVVYSAILKVILIFTGNIITVPFIFQIACFTIFMICCFFTVKQLLGMSAAVVSTAYLAFVPVFTNAFTGLELSTDSLFMAMFGLELLVVGQYLKGAYKGIYVYKLWIIGYIIVGVVVGFMAYVDAGTIIMILPFFMAAPMLYGRKPSKEVLRLVPVLIAAVITFIGMLVQEAGFYAFNERLSNWASYYFHNLNTFSAFWVYTDHKMLYLITVIAMSGIIVGFWKNRQVEKISPWLLSMILIFATVPFMGATRMNTQVFVTVYYALILGCVSSLITLPAHEAGDYEPDEDLGWVDPEKEGETKEAAVENEAATEQSVASAAENNTENAAAEEIHEQEEASETEEALEPERASEQEKTSEPEETPEFEEVPETERVTALEETPEYEVSGDDENTVEAEKVPEPEGTKEPEEVPVPEETPESGEASLPEKKERFVPEGMVLPEDDDDVDLTPRMKMPELKVNQDANGKPKKLHINRPEKESDNALDERDTIVAAIKEINESVPKYIDEMEGDESGSDAKIPQIVPEPEETKDDFDLSLKPGDDFDI